MIILSVITAVFTGRVDETVNAVFEGASTAVSTLISFAGAMCFWTGIMKVAEKSGVSDFICRLISPDTTPNPHFQTTDHTYSL